jgi:hypothetical protein
MGGMKHDAQVVMASFTGLLLKKRFSFFWAEKFEVLE